MSIITTRVRDAADRKARKIVTFGEPFPSRAPRIPADGPRRIYWRVLVNGKRVAAETGLSKAGKGRDYWYNLVAEVIRAVEA